MKLWIGITDDDWFEFLSGRPDLDEVNFWQPSGSRAFRALAPGEPFLFKLHAPNHFIAGGGFFARYSALPVDLAWDAFQEKNGAESLEQMRERIAKYRRVDPGGRENFVIGCNILVEPFFFPRDLWIPIPADFSLHVQQGKTYDAERRVPAWRCGRPSGSGCTLTRDSVSPKAMRRCGARRRWFANGSAKARSAFWLPTRTSAAVRSRARRRCPCSRRRTSSR